MLIDEVETIVLLRLHDQIDEPDEPLSAAQIGNSFRPEMSEDDLLKALTSLIDRDFVIQGKHGHGRSFKISREGILKVESGHKILTTIDRTSNVVRRAYNAMPHPSAEKSVTRLNVDWTMWGTILTGVGVIVAILIWKLS